MGLIVNSSLVLASKRSIIPGFRIGRVKSGELAGGKSLVVRQCVIEKSYKTPSTGYVAARKLYRRNFAYMTPCKQQTMQITVQGCTSGEVPISVIPSGCSTSGSRRFEALSMICDSLITVDLESEGREQSL